MIQESNIDPKQLIDEPKNFSQNPIFSACIVSDHLLGFRMTKALTELGCDPLFNDALKQTPLFYAARDGNTQIINYIVNEMHEDVNKQDKYGQTCIYYAVREGHVAAAQLLIDSGALIDQTDTKNQRPIFYAIMHNKYEMLKFLIDKGSDVSKEDKKGLNPATVAKKLNKEEMLTLLLESGAAPPSDPRRSKDNRRPVKQVVAAPPEPKPIENERKIPRRYMLTKLREGGFYSPMTDQEFTEFKRTNPELAKYFETDDDGEVLHSISGLSVPEVPESAPIFDQWEKAAQRLLTTLQRNQKAYIFAHPVDYKKLKIEDYPNIVKNPMDFSTVKTKLKEHKYARIQDFMDDMELVFYNCRLYNGTETEVGRLGMEIMEEYHTIA